MKCVFVCLISPPSQLKGYIKRFLIEFHVGVFIGSANVIQCDDLVANLESWGVQGFAVWSSRNECGFNVPYFNIEGQSLRDFDGQKLIEKLEPISMQSIVHSRR